MHAQPVRHSQVYASPVLGNRIFYPAEVCWLFFHVGVTVLHCRIYLDATPDSHFTRQRSIEVLRLMLHSAACKASQDVPVLLGVEDGT